MNNQYITYNLIDFFTKLKNNNNREWFNKNKNHFELFVKEPFYKLISDLMELCNEIDPKILHDLNKSIFRIYKDVRFSKDKEPYKTHLSAVLSENGKSISTQTGFCVQASNEGITIYAGIYYPSPSELIKIKFHLLKYSNEFEQLLNDKDFKNNFGELLGDESKKISKEFKEFENKYDWLLKKAFYFKSQLTIEEMLSDNLLSYLYDKYCIYFKFKKLMSNLN